MPNFTNFYTANLAWLSLDTGAGGLVPLLGHDLTGPPVAIRMGLSHPDTDNPEYPFLSYRIIGHVGLVVRSDVGRNRLHSTTIDYRCSCDDANGGQAKVISVLDRLEDLLDPKDADWAARNPADNMSDANVSIIGHEMTTRSPERFNDDLKVWWGVISVAYNWRSVD